MLNVVMLSVMAPFIFCVFSDEVTKSHNKIGHVNGS
jgi:hypothetical protein